MPNSSASTAPGVRPPASGAVRAQIPATTPVHIAEFIDAHLLMLTDSALVDATRDLIRERSVNASWALQLQRDTLVEIFDQMEDPICAPGATTSTMWCARSRSF
jgi:phosphoenolpyruvate-protein kinase (PTS system EI component)